MQTGTIKFYSWLELRLVYLLNNLKKKKKKSIRSTVNWPISLKIRLRYLDWEWEIQLLYKD